MFYLDGFDGQTTKSLRLQGFLDKELFTANIFANTAAVLKVRKIICLFSIQDVLSSAKYGTILIEVYMLSKPDLVTLTYYATKCC